VERDLSKNEENNLVLPRKDASDRVDCEREGHQLLRRRCVPGRCRRLSLLRGRCLVYASPRILEKANERTNHEFPT
jgi:hypothetical protein